jgi:hypothetical protein
MKVQHLGKYLVQKGLLALLNVKKSHLLFPIRLQVYRYLAPLRLLVCGGDGSVGWVLKEIDKLQLKVDI